MYDADFCQYFNYLFPSNIIFLLYSKILSDYEKKKRIITLPSLTNRTDATRAYKQTTWQMFIYQNQLY